MQSEKKYKNLELLHCRIGSIVVCMDLQYINKVLLLVALEAVPGSPAYLAGLMNYFDKIIPVVDLSLYLGVERRSLYTIETPLIICGDANHMTGFIVDNVINITDLTKEDIDFNEKFDKANSFYLAVVKTNGIQSLLLNMEKILAQDFINHDVKKLTDNKFITDRTI
jgi:chemotaxis signal transduction protein